MWLLSMRTKKKLYFFPISAFFFSISIAKVAAKAFTKSAWQNNL